MQRAADWSAVLEATDEGALYKYLQQLPRELWNERGPFGVTILHFAAQDDQNLDAARALIRNGTDVNARGWSTRLAPIQVAVLNDSVEMVRLLCSVRARFPPELLEAAALLKCGKVLVANGARNAPVELREMERAVLRCRAAVVALFLLKTRHKKKEWFLTVDRNLIRLVALSLWATRDADEWIP